MTPRQRRMTLVLGIVAGVGIAGALALTAFRQNVTFFFDPTAVVSGKVHPGEQFRLGGMVEKGSVHRDPGSLDIHFVVTDFKSEVPVTFSKVLPDLFREGTGVVAHGQMVNGTFVADEVLAKHDEKYMPPAVAKSLKRQHGEPRMDIPETPDASPTPAPPAGTAPTSQAQPRAALPFAQAAPQAPFAQSAPQTHSTSAGS